MNNRIYQAKCEYLDKLYEDYEVSSNQMATMLDDKMRHKLKRGLETILKEIHQYEEELGISQKDIQPLPSSPQLPISDSLPVIFRIQLSQRNGEMKVRGLSVPDGGTPVESVPLPYSFEQLPAILKALDVGKFISSRFKDEYVPILEELELLQDEQLHPDLYKQVGQKLYDALFTGDVKTEFTIAERQGAVACQIQFDAGSDDIILAQFPWEVVHNGRNPLVPIRDGLELTRSIAFAAPPNVLETTLPLRMLLIHPQPQNDTNLGDKETRVIQDALEPLVSDKQLVIEELTPPTWSALDEKLSDTQYDIIHFDGHGSFVRECPTCKRVHYPGYTKCVTCGADMSLKPPQGYLHFEDDEKNRDRVSKDDLQVTLEKSGTRLIVLSACGSGVVKGTSVFNGVAPGLIEIGIPAVVAMQGSPLAVTTAVFMQRMYTSLAKGTRLPQAVNDGRRAIYRHKPPMWFMPVVYLRSSDNTFGQLFKLT